MSWHVPEQYRVMVGHFGIKGEPFGAFDIPFRNTKSIRLMVLASNGMQPNDPHEWQHVSVHTETPSPLGGDKWLPRIPTWNEMCFVKDLFWDDDDCVVQFHPPKSDYVNNHKHVLHMWKYNGEFPMPPKDYV